MFARSCERGITHLRAIKMSDGITQCYLPPNEPTQCEFTRFNPSHLGRYPIYLPPRVERLSWQSNNQTVPQHKRHDHCSKFEGRRHAKMYSLQWKTLIWYLKKQQHMFPKWLYLSYAFSWPLNRLSRKPRPNIFTSLFVLTSNQNYKSRSARYGSLNILLCLPPLPRVSFSCVRPPDTDSQKQLKFLR